MLSAVPKKTIPLEERFQVGRIVDIDQDICRIKLDQVCKWAQYARVRLDQLPTGESFLDYFTGDEVDVFLLNPVHGFPDSFHGSLTWGLREENPWLTTPPKVGAVDTATAIQYLGHSGILVRLSSGIEALLRVGEVPSGQHDITQVIDIGDQMVVQITAVRKNLLEVVTSVKGALETLRRQEIEQRKQEFASKSIQVLPEQQQELERTKDIILAVLGPDQLFTRQLNQWLEGFGVICTSVTSGQELLDILQARNHPSHVLSVTRVWKSPDFARRANDLLQKQGIKWLWLKNVEEDYSTPFSGPVLNIPLNVGQLLQWLVEGLEPQSDSQQSQPFTFNDYHLGHVQELVNLGIATTAYLHELGQAALPITYFLDSSSRGNKAPNPDEWKVLRKELTTLLHLIKSDHSIIHRQQSSRTISIYQRLRNIAKFFSYRAGPINCAFLVTMPDHLMKISIPAPLFDQVINNLLDNAYHFVANMQYNIPRIEIRVSLDNKNWSRPLTIDVQDNGPGIRANMKDKVFMILDTDKETGTGMGLYIVKSLLNGVGGDVELLKSIRWQQTIFRVSLPILLDKQIY